MKAEDVRVCAVCARVLDYAEGRGYFHGFGDNEADHMAVPVVPSEVKVRPRCDFCYTDESVWVLPARDFVADFGYGSQGDWSACECCGRLIDTNQWSRLLRRVVASRQARTREPMAELERMALSRLYRKLRQNVTGPLRRL